MVSTRPIRSTMMNVPLSLNHLLERAGHLFPSNEIVSRLPDKSLVRHTYGQFYGRTRQLAQAMARALGLEPYEFGASSFRSGVIALRSRRKLVNHW
jgi:fatty-acyl-CoA synthase